ncbi:MAG TPA: hypothetical protein VG537_09095 [Candidatus Kapabacteria bacterium]|jgi:hypothetical protein|nr:hypothetical protein [Candidatus Kapabacteria bacterium]
MKPLHFAAAALFVATLLSSCQQDPQSANGPQTVLPLTPGGSTITWNAHPEIVYFGDTTVGSGHSGSSYPGLWVMDSTGANWKCIYYSTSGEGDFHHPTWSPGGGSVCWEAQNGSTYYLHTINVSTSNGVPVGSNMSTIWSHNWNTDSNSFMEAAWSSVSSNNVIAYLMYYGPGRSSKLYTIPASGGTPTLIYSDTGCEFEHLTWSPDGSLIAIALVKASGKSLRVVDMSGNVVHEYARSSVAPIEYARTSGKIFSGYGTTLTSMDTSTGNTTTIGTAYSASLCPSPTDWKVAYSSNASPYRISTMLTSNGDTTQIRSSNSTGDVVGSVNWRRQ